MKNREKELLERAYRAWIIPGVNPAYHRRMRENVRRDMPVLAAALDELERVRHGRTFPIIEVAGPAAPEAEELDEGTTVVDTRPVCEDCGLPLSRDETTDSLNRGRLLCWDHDEGMKL